MFYPIIVLY